MKSEDKNVSEISKNHAILITMCVVASVLALVGIKIMLTSM